MVFALVRSILFSIVCPWRTQRHLPSLVGSGTIFDFGRKVSNYSNYKGGGNVKKCCFSGLGSGSAASGRVLRGLCGAALCRVREAAAAAAAGLADGHGEDCRGAGGGSADGRGGLGRGQKNARNLLSALRTNLCIDTVVRVVSLSRPLGENLRAPRGGLPACLGRPLDPPGAARG